MPDTITSLPNKPLQEITIVKQAGMTSWRCLRFLQGIGSPQGAGRRGNGEPSDAQSFPDQISPFQRTPVEPEWLSCVLQDKDLYPQMCIYMLLSQHTCTTKKPAACRDTTSQP